MSKPMPSSMLYLLTVGSDEPLAVVSPPSLRSNLDLDDPVGYLPQVGAHHIRALCERVQDHTGAGYEGGRATGAHGAGHIPGVGRDEPELADLDPEAVRRQTVRFGRGLQAFHGIGGEDLLEVVPQAGVVDLGVGDLLR